MPENRAEKPRPFHNPEQAKPGDAPPSGETEATGAPKDTGSKPTSEKKKKEKIKEEKKKAKTTIDKLEQGAHPVRRALGTPESLEELKEEVKTLQKEKTGQWLLNEIAELPDDPVVLKTLTEIAAAPPELQNDPTWLLAKGAELRYSLRSDAPEELRNPLRASLNAIHRRIAQQTGIDMSDPKTRASKDPKIVEKVDFVEFAGHHLHFEESGMAPRRTRRARGRDGRGDAITESEWIYSRDATGKPEVPEDTTDASGDIVNKEELRQALQHISKLGDNPNPSELNDAYLLLSQMPDATGGRITEDEVRQYKERVKRTYMVMSNERFMLTPDIIRKLEDPKTRDEVFFDRMKTVLDEPDQPSREIMNLYKEAELDAFMYAMGTLPNGELLTKHFANLKQTIIAFHDLDYYARSASGDVKSFLTAASYFQNAYAVEALSDPLVEALLQSYEQALKTIRDNNDGYIPPSLVSYSPKRHENYWDELAKKIFEEKVKAGVIRDSARDTSGFGRLDKEGRAFELGETFTEKDLETQQLRVRASMQMAKGMGILNNRLLEIFAFSKTPGYANNEYGTEKGKGPIFSSKAYEGIARWFNPMADWFGKYKMGDSMFGPFFATLIGVDRAQLKEFMFWDQRQWKKIIDMASEGTLHDWLEKKYGKKAGRMLNLVTEFAFSGRFGPLSGWGEHDVTLNFTDKEREREGGAMRLFKAKEWADLKLEEKYGKSEWNKKKYTKEGEEEITKYTHGYQAWIWVQTTMRSPTMVAGAVRDISEAGEYVVGGEKMHRKLRSVIVKQILDINIEEDVKSEQTPQQKKRDMMARIELLESDVMLLQQAALYGDSGKPRDILQKDIELIKGERQHIVDGKAVIVDEQTRRSQAWDYVQMVRVKMLGNGDWAKTDKWEAELGTGWKDANLDRLVIGNTEAIHRILEPIDDRKTALLTIDLLDKKQPIHMGLEDVQWRYLDLETLGERSWARRASDLESRANAIMAMIKHLDTLRPHPDLREMAKTLEEVYNAEKNHDPNEAHKFVFLMAKATGEMYKQVTWGKFPLLGRLVSRVVPSSVAQQIYGTDHGAAWSTNNMHEFVGVVQQATKLPYKHVDPAGNPHPYNIHRLERELGATKLWAIVEMLGIGSVLAALLTVGLALKEGVEEEKKH